MSDLGSSISDLEPRKLKGVARCKICVCGASSQLSRERSRLLKIEKELNKWLPPRMAALDAQEHAIDEQVARAVAAEKQLKADEQDLEREREAFEGRKSTMEFVLEKNGGRSEVLISWSQQLSELEQVLSVRKQRLAQRSEKVAADLEALGADAAEVAELTAKLDEEERQLDDEEKEAACDADSFQKLQDELADLSALVQRQVEAVAAKRGEVEPLQAQAQQEADKALEAEKQLLEKQESVERLAARLESLDNEVQDLQDQDAERRAALKAAEEELKLVSSVLDEEEEVIREMEASLERQGVELKQRVQSIDSSPGQDVDLDEDDMDLRLAALEAQEHAAAEKRRRYEGAAAALQAELDRYEEEAQRLEAQLRGLDE